MSAERQPPAVSRRQHAHAIRLRDSVAEILSEFVPATDARRAIDDLNALVSIIRRLEDR